MTKRVGIISDVHGDKQNESLAVRTFQQLGIDSAMFLGDAIYNTMSDTTSSDLSKSYAMRTQLRQDSQFRKDVMKGLFSDEQLEKIVSSIETGKSVGKRIAKAEYQDMQSAFSSLDMAVLGGNWDYRDEMTEIFGDDLLNATAKELNGLKVLGFTGGGSPTIKTATTETFADDKNEQGNQYETWAQKLMSQEPLNADVLISHVPFTDGEGMEKENAVEHLKNLVLRRKEANLDVPNVLIYGHRHNGGEVKYDAEMDSFLVSPGSSSRNHNSALPTFMVSEFDDDNKLLSVDKYGIYSSLAGLSEVRLVATYVIDQENKEVDYQEKNEIVLQDIDPVQFRDNLSLDDNIQLTQAGLNVNYEPLKDSPKELDQLVRSNIAIMFKDTEKVSQEMNSVFSEIAIKYIETEERERNIEAAIEEAEVELGKLASQKVGADYSVIDSSPFAKFLRRDLMSVVLGTDVGKMSKSLYEQDLNTLDDVSGWGKSVVEESSNKLSNDYQRYMFKDLEAENFQGMAECYLPAAYKRTTDLDEGAAFQLWLSTYKEGLMTSDKVEATNAYEKNEDYTARERTKENLAEMFSFNGNQEVENNVPQQREGRRNERGEGNAEVGEEQINAIRQGISSGRIPVLSEDGNEYLVNPQNGQRIPFNANELGLNPGDYNPLNAEEYQNQMRANQINNLENQLGNLREQENQANGDNVDIARRVANGVNQPLPAREYLDRAV
jgi:predicted phosphodiesterase